jgi:hypothetical protein
LVRAFAEKAGGWDLLVVHTGLGNRLILTKKSSDALLFGLPLPSRWRNHVEGAKGNYNCLKKHFDKQLVVHKV